MVSLRSIIYTTRYIVIHNAYCVNKISTAARNVKLIEYINV